MAKPLDGVRACRPCIAHSRTEPCAGCGAAREPVSRDGQGRPVCANCFSTAPENLETCTGCGRVRPVGRRKDAGRGAERIDLRQLPGTLRLEVQYVLQGRRDEQRAPLVPATVQRILGDLAATGVTSLLDRPEPAWEQFGPRRGRGCGWRAFAPDARQRIEARAVATRWGHEYTPRAC